MMRLLTILLLFTLNTNAQFGDFGLVTQPTPTEGFNWDNLQVQSPTLYSGGCGTIEVTNKSFTNLNASNQNGADIKVEGGTCNITFRNCYFGPSRGVGAYLRQFTGTIRFVNCLFVSNSGGVLAEDCSANIQIDSCQVVNPWGARDCRGQIIQFSSVTTTNSYVRYTRGISFRGEGYTEDWISMFMSSGTSGNPIHIHDNMVQNGGPSPSGGGFMSGDSGGSWQLVENNKLLNPGNYILACSGGENITIRNNLGYQSSAPWMNIAMYAYNVAAPTCANITVEGNGMFISNGNYWYAPGGSETCSPVSGTSFSDNNLPGITLAQLNFPTTLIDFVDEDRLWHLRDESVQFRNITGTCEGSKPAQLFRPTSNAGADQNITISTATLNGSGSVSTNGSNYKWVIVSGPNVPTMSAPLAVTNNLSGLITGTYVIRLEFSDNDGAADADWLTVNVVIT